MQYNGKHCIVTGGSGFIGQNLVNALIREGAIVHVIDNFSYGGSRIHIHPDAQVYTGNVMYEESFNQLPDQEYAYLFHFAGPSSVIFFNKTPRYCIYETVLGLVRAMDYCSKRSIKLIFPSSGSVYAGIEPPHAEHSKLNTDAINTYAETKYYLEQVQHVYRFKCDSLALRIFAGYGEQEGHKGEAASVVYSFCKAMREGKSPVIFGDGTQTRDFIYSADLVDAIMALAETCNEKVINIGTGASISFQDLVQNINESMGTSIEPTYVAKPTAYLEKTQADTSRLHQYFQKPITPIGYGIERILSQM